MTVQLDRLEMDEAAAPNPYLLGAYAPVDDEVTLDDLEVIGDIPAELDGVLVRNGPNPQFWPPRRYHWFDGDGMLHAARIRDGRVAYRNRWVRTEAFQRESSAERAMWTGIMEPVVGNPPDLPLKDTANTDVVLFHNRVLALWYLTGKPYAIDPLSLTTLSAEDFRGTLRCDVSAHAKVDEHTGELLFFDYGPRPPYMRYGVVGAGGAVEHLVDIDLPGPRLPHDMAITEHFAILMDLPLVNDPEAARQGRHKLYFDRNLPARFGVIPRRGEGDAIRWFDAEPCYVYHTINAWEEGDEVVLDLCRVSRPAPSQHTAGPLAKMLSYLRLDAHLHRYRFHLGTGAVREEPLDDASTEFPSIDLRSLGRRSRYAYNVRISPEPTLLFDAIVKYDTVAKTSQAYEMGAGRWASEAPFAPKPGGTAEDDGWVLSFVYDENEQRSELVILDAHDITLGPVARVLIPRRIPIGFHACWAPGERLG